VARRLQEQGKVRFIGVTEPMPGAALEPGSKNAVTAEETASGGSAFTGHEMVVQAANDGIWDVVMLKYGVLDQSAARSALAAAKAAGLGVLNMSAVRGALVTPTALEATLLEWKAKGLLDPGALSETDPLEFVIHDNVSSIVAAGYRFVVEEDAISTVLVGSGNIEHLEQGVEAILAGPLPPEDNARLRHLFGRVTLQRE
jgi:predicted aldo/keto reductase-like oxidoreductase